MFRNRPSRLVASCTNLFFDNKLPKTDFFCIYIVEERQKVREKVANVNCSFYFCLAKRAFACSYSGNSLAEPLFSDVESDA